SPGTKRRSTAALQNVSAISAFHSRLGLGVCALLCRFRFSRQTRNVRSSSRLAFSCRALSLRALPCAKVEQQTNECGGESRQRFDGLPAQQIKHHPKCDDSEDNRRNRISPHPVRPGDFRARSAQHHHAEHSEQRTEQQAKLSVLHHAFKAACEQKYIHDEQLQHNGVCGNAVRILAPKQSQQPMIFAHRHAVPPPSPRSLALTAKQRPTQTPARATPPPFVPKICLPAINATSS